MFIPFYNRIEKQEFRKHNDREFLIPETAILTYSRQLPAFQYIVRDFSSIDIAELISISTTGRQLNTWALPADYVTITDVGGGDYRLGCTGEVLPSPITFGLFYIKLTSGSKNLVSEVFCKVEEKGNKGVILLNTGAYLLNNDGGGFLLNESEEVLSIDSPIEIKYSATKSYGKFDLGNFIGTFLVKSEVNFLRSVEENDSETFDGLRTDFEKIVSSIYSIEFMASRQVCDLLNQLYFFENIEITDQDGCIYIPQEPVSVIKEREEMTGFYNIVLEFKINNTLNYSEITTTPDQEDTDLNDYVGIVFDHFSNNTNINKILTTRNAELTNHEWVRCDGQELLAQDHPITASVLGTEVVGNVRVIKIPKLWGLVCAGIGQYIDSVGNIETIQPVDIGEIRHELTINEMAEHDHPKGLSTITSGGGRVSGFPDAGLSGLRGRGYSHNNMQPTYGTYKIMLIDK